jgi:crotonobetainyl-CoA:carnitine CoA-transferase CaiB-like acyl-CoA transferase
MSPEPLPLHGLSVVDFGLGLAGSLVCQQLKELGAAIARVEPDAGDPFYDIYPAYRTWQHGKVISYAPDLEAGIAAMNARLSRADVCVIGGEDYPELAWKCDVDALASSYPALVILVVSGGRAGSIDAQQPAVELLMQARSGLLFEQYSDRPFVFAFPACSYGAACQGLIGLMSALCERERSRLGQIVRTSLFEGAMSWLGHDWYEFDTHCDVADDTTPKGNRPLIFRCADGKYIHMVMASTDSRRHAFTLLGVRNPVPSLDEDPRGLPSIARGARNYYGDKDMLQEYVSRWKRDDLLKALGDKGVAAEAVNQPGQAWGDPQVSFNELLRTDAQGNVHIGLPFKLSVKPADGLAPAAPEPGDRPALSGTRVVDFGSFTAGPHASVILRDLGADVIKIEPLNGDVMRFYFLKYTASSRGKRVIALDMKKPGGLAIALKLCSRAHIVHHNFRPGVTERLGIDVASLHKIKPDLIVLETAAYGISGPRARQGGFDMTFHAFCGHEVRASGQGNEPELYRLPIVDLSAGLLGAIALLVARFVNLRSGAGAAIATSLLNAGLYLLSELVRRPDGQFSELPEVNHQQTGFHPAERIYAVGDQWIAIAARGNSMAARLISALHLAERIRTPRDAWGEREASLIALAIAGQDLDAFLKRLKAADVWAVACRSDAKAATLSDPGMRAGAAVLSADDPRYGRFVQLGTQFTLSRSPTTGRGDSPAVGEHTRHVLTELGYGPEEIDRLYRDKVVA